VHHRDARVERVARGVEVDRRAGENDLALVRAVEAGEDVGERRLAGAVLAQQGVDLAGGSLEVDVLVRDDRGKALRDPAQRDRRRWRGGVSLPAGTVNPWRYRSRL
jgi:hypothetical protein